MQSTFSTSNLLIGIIDEIEVRKIKKPNVQFYGRDRTNTQELANSIRHNGLLHPIVVRTKGNFFEIVAGCRRYSACRTLGFRKIICHVVEMDDKAAFEVSLTENIQRRSLDPIEEARAFKLYVDEFGWGGMTELAYKISKSPTYVSKRLSLLHLPDEILERVRKRDLSPSTAEELIPIEGSNQQHWVADIIAKSHYSSRQARRLVEVTRGFQANSDGRTESFDHFYYQERLSDIESKAHRSFDKSITALKIAINKIAAVLETVEDNWIVYEILMQHRNMLNAQIDVLIREKKKLR